MLKSIEEAGMDELIKELGIKSTKYVNDHDLAKAAVKILLEDKVIGIHKGRSEFG